MSRIGKNPVGIPDKVKADINGNLIQIAGPKGTLAKSFDAAVSFSLEDGKIIITPANGSRHAKAMWGTARSIIQGMVQGVVEPYRKDVEISGVGFKAAIDNNVINLALGYSHPITYRVPEGVSVEIDKTGTKLAVTGCDKHSVGQVAADIKSFYPMEPYKGKGVRIVGEFVRRKEGKKSG